MINILFISIFVAFAPIQRQAVSYNEIKSPDLVRLFNGLIVLAESRTNDLSVRVLETSNEPGSAGFDNGEVTSNIYIAVSEFDESPAQNLFKLSPLYWPKIQKIDTVGDTPIVYLSYATGSKRVTFKRVTLKITCSLSKLHIESVK